MKNTRKCHKCKYTKKYSEEYFQRALNAVQTGMTKSEASLKVNIPRQSSLYTKLKLNYNKILFWPNT